MQPEPLVFVEDRSDVVRRALPRQAVGTAGWCPLVVAVVVLKEGAERRAVAAASTDPPALFRWQDRGGLEDVTAALVERLGPAINHPITVIDRSTGG